MSRVLVVSAMLAAQHCHMAPSHPCSQGRQQPNVLILGGSLAAAVKIGEGLSTELGAMSYSVPNPIFVPSPIPVLIHVSFPISIPIPISVPISGGCRLSLLPPCRLCQLSSAEPQKGRQSASCQPSMITSESRDRTWW